MIQKRLPPAMVLGMTLVVLVCMASWQFHATSIPPSSTELSIESVSDTPQALDSTSDTPQSETPPWGPVTLARIPDIPGSMLATAASVFNRRARELREKEAGGNDHGYKVGQCPTEDVMVLARKAGSPADGTRQAIPFLGTNFDYDPMAFLPRLMSSISRYPITHQLVVAGGCHESVLTELQEVYTRYPDVHIFHHPQRLGCSPGWNVLTAYMAMHDDIPWGMLVNNDIYAPPGSLRVLANEIWSEYESDPLLCMGIVKQQFDHKLWSVLVYTRRAMEVLGFFDENIWPAYYEDDDFKIRLRAAVNEGLCSPLRFFNTTRLIHGYDPDYVSGNARSLGGMAESGDSSDAQLSASIDAVVKRGIGSSQLYLQKKWGCPPGTWDFPKCDTCSRPFDDDKKALSHWTFSQERRACLETGSGHPLCDFL